MIVILIFIALLVVVALVTMMLIQKTDPANKNKAGGSQSNATDNAERPKSGLAQKFGPIMDTAASYLGILGVKKDNDPKTAQEFIPFDKIEDSMICFTDVNGMKYYRMILECSSINYNLKTPEEQEIIDQQFKSSIDAWDFPWGIYIQTRIMDNRGIKKQTEKEITDIISRYPTLEEYGMAYYDFIDKKIAMTSSNVLIKRKFIVIACNEASTMEELDEVDQQDWAFETLSRRADTVRNSLSRIGIACNICDNSELSSIIFQAFNKRSGGAIDGIVDGEFLSGSVNGYAPEKELDPQELSELIREFVNQIDVAIINSPKTSFDDKARARKVQEQASHLMDVFYKDRNGGTY